MHPGPLGAASTRWLLGLCVFAYLWLFPWSEAINNPNEMVRVYAVRAIVEDGTYAIGARGPTGDHGLVTDQWGYVNDKAMKCSDGGTPPTCTGKLYQAKAPGVTFLGVIPHAVLRGVYRLLHLGQPSKAMIVWWLRFWVVILPTLLAWWWLARWLPTRLTRPGLGHATLLAAALGSLSLTYGQMFAGHQAGGVALVALFACIVLAGAIGNGGAIVLAGLAGGWATCIEFPMAPAVFLLCGWIWVRRRDPNDIWRVAVGALLPALLLGHNNWRSFGTPWSLPYANLENAGFVRDLSPGIFGIHLPNREKVMGSLFSSFTGLYFYAPWTILAWLGWLGVRRNRPRLGDDWCHGRRGEALIATLICSYFLMFQCSHSLWHAGWVVGPRYLTAMVPFAAIAAAHGMDSLRSWRAHLGAGLLAALGVASIVITGVCTAVSQGFPGEVINPLPEVVGPLLRTGWAFPNPLMALGVKGPWNALPYFLALALGALTLVWLALRDVRPRPGPRVLAALVALALAVLLIRAEWRVNDVRTPDEKKATLQFMTMMWTPPHPPGAKPL